MFGDSVGKHEGIRALRAVRIACLIKEGETGKIKTRGLKSEKLWGNSTCVVVMIGTIEFAILNSQEREESKKIGRKLRRGGNGRLQEAVIYCKNASYRIAGGKSGVNWYNHHSLHSFSLSQ